MTEPLEELKEKVIHTLYVDLNHLAGSELLDELVSQAHEAGVEAGKAEVQSKNWYFEGDELVITKGKWVIDRYKRNNEN